MSAKPTLVQLILNATTAGKAMLTAANAAAQKTLLSLVKGDVGLGNVDNTADSAKPVSELQQAAIDLKLGGSLGSTDNRLLRSDGTGAITAQGSTIAADDSGNLSGVGTVGCGSLTTTGNIATPGISSFANNGIQCGGINIGRGASITVAGEQINVFVNFVRKFSLAGQQMNASSDFSLNVRNNVSNLAGANDCSLIRNTTSQWATLSDSGLAIRNFANSADAALTAGTIISSALIGLGTYTVATLPSASANPRRIAAVTDSSVTTNGSAVAGGGSSSVMVFSNGSTWDVVVA